jgi:ribose transport system ATP-binding protein
MLLCMSNICKSFAGVVALQDAHFELRPGEVHILAGENGAGKTTLVKILTGVHTDYQGEIELDGRKIRFISPHDAARQGISAIYQEMSLVGPMSVVDNIFLGRELGNQFCPRLFMDRSRQRARAQELCSELGLDIDLDRPVEDYPLAVRTLIEIAKALALNARILIMDEPTSALNQHEVDRLFQIIAGLKRRGTAVLYITHRMEEIYRIGDRVTVLRDARSIGTSPIAGLSQSELIRWMIGRELDTFSPSTSVPAGDECLRVAHFSVAESGRPSRQDARPLVNDVSFTLRAGEVLGIAGLQGSGNNELLAGLFGARSGLAHGEVYLGGRPFPVRSPQWSVRHGLAHLSSDRKGTGLIMNLDVTRNISLASLRKLSPWGFVLRTKERAMAERQVQALTIQAASLLQEVQFLSGGNQQKVMLAKWIETRPKVLLLDEPTRGIDVGAKREIYELINRWKEDGIGILLITSELPELLGLADRILVMHRGCVCAEFPRALATQENILRAAMGEAWKN